MDFLSFKRFISIEVLITFYYIGAVMTPLMLWSIMSWAIKRYQLIETDFNQVKEELWQTLTPYQKFKALLFFILSFLFMELFLRIFFEFLIAYMQIRDAIVL
ncbi:MAG: DUF4282 domain-containing protein [Gammaproteobacteria bacterium]|nr:DUF4282 domain-containing protein [Gammaproteobacteria bacterium]